MMLKVDLQTTIACRQIVIRILASVREAYLLMACVVVPIMITHAKDRHLAIVAAPTATGQLSPRCNCVKLTSS